MHILIIATISTFLLLLASSTTATLLLPISVLALNLYDNFEEPPYTITDNQTSPNGKWFNKYSGFGASGAVTITSLMTTEIIVIVIIQFSMRSRILQQIPMKLMLP